MAVWPNDWSTHIQKGDAEKPGGNEPEVDKLLQLPWRMVITLLSRLFPHDCLSDPDDVYAGGPQVRVEGRAVTSANSHPRLSRSPAHARPARASRHPHPT